MWFPCCPGPAPPGRCSGPPLCSLCVWCCVYGALGPLASVHRCARSVCGVACTASWASWLLVTPLCTPCVWCCVHGFLGLLAPAHRRARSVCGVAGAVSWAAWSVVTGVHARCVLLRARCPAWAAWLLFTGLPPSVRCVVCMVSWAPWLLFTGVHALCAVLYVQRPGPPGSRSPVRVLAVCSSLASYPPPSSSLVLVHALRDCPPAFSCRRLLVLVAPLAIAFESPSVLVRSFGLSFSSVPWLLSSLSSLPTSPCSCLSFPPSCPLRSGLFWSGLHVPIRLPFFSFSSPLALSPPASRLPSFLSSPFCSLLFFLFSSPCRSAAVSFSLYAAPDLPFPGRFVPGRSSPGALRPRMFQSAAPGAPPDFLPYSLCCPRRSSPWHRVHPRTIQSGGSGRASFRPGCSNPGRLFDLFFPLPGAFHPVVPGSPLDDPVRGLVPCFVPSRMLHSGAPFNRILSFASDAPVRGTGFTPGRSSPGAIAVLRAAPDAPIRGVFLSYSLRCPGRSSPWHRVHPRTIQSGGYCRASCRPGCSYPGRLFIVFSPLPRMLPSVAPGSPPDDPVRGLVPCFIPPRLLQSCSVFLSYSLRCLGRSSPWRRVHPRTIQSGG